jgi:flagellar basal body-associated protein FliL
VKADPARQARIEREDRNKLRWLTILAFVVAAVVGLFAVGEWQIHSIVSSHNSELAQIDAIVKHVNNSQANHYQTVKDIEAIVKADTADKNLVILGTGEGLADYQAICNAIPGCKLPYPSP